MSNKKQTAVEWLIDKLEKHYVHHDLKNTVVFEQAKTMEKEQIIETYNKNKMGRVDYGEQYYKETFKSE